MQNNSFRNSMEKFFSSTAVSSSALVVDNCAKSVKELLMGKMQWTRNLTCEEINQRLAATTASFCKFASHSAHTCFLGEEILHFLAANISHKSSSTFSSAIFDCTSSQGSIAKTTLFDWHFCHYFGHCQLLPASPHTL